MITFHEKFKSKLDTPLIIYSLDTRESNEGKRARASSISLFL